MMSPGVVRAVILAAGLLVACPVGHAQCCAAGDTPPLALAESSLPAAQWVTPTVLSGGTPEGAAGFAALRALGVATVISVDGAAPEVELAQQFGLSYVHLPHGYSGVPADRAMQLSKAVRDLPGPIYIHCHHGKHRSPAAAAVACVGAGMLSPDDAAAVLESAGASKHYRGLYDSASHARPYADDALDRLSVTFEQTVKPQPMVQAMIELDRLHRALRRSQQAGWKPAAPRAASAPAHHALLLREQFVELLRTQHPTLTQPAVKPMLRESLESAEQLEAALATSPVNRDAARRAVQQISASCRACHAQSRDLPRNQR